MFFLTRACLCIGTIVVLAEGVDVARLVSTPPDMAAVAASAAGPLQALCREHPADCVAAMKAAVGASAQAPEPPPRLIPKRDPPPRPPDHKPPIDRRV